MAKYLIHACPKRMWYVEGYLIPSMLKQGIVETNISVYNDSAGLGNLRACMDAFSKCDSHGGTWHLQDDVCICKDFKERTEEYDEGLVCGFSSLFYDGDIEEKKGEVTRENMWFSFPCIRIPDHIARECAEWITEDIIGNPVYRRYWEKGVNDDWAFRLYLKQAYPSVKAINLIPCLVDHIDFMIGGGTGEKQRKRPVRAQYWEDDESIKELEEWLNGRKR